MSPLYMAANIENGLAPRVEFGNYLPQIITVEVGVNLRGGDGLVPEHLLDSTQVSPAFDQVGGKRMPKGMRTDAFGDAGGLRQVFDDGENHDACEPGAPSVQKNVRPMPWLDLHVDAVAFDVHVDKLLGCSADGYEPLLVAFADDPEKAYVKVEVLHTKVDQLADPEPGAVQGLQNGPVARAFGGRHVDGIQQLVYLDHAEGVGQLSTELGRINQLHRVFADLPFEEQVLVKRL